MYPVSGYYLIDNTKEKTKMILKARAFYHILTRFHKFSIVLEQKILQISTLKNKVTI